MSVTLELIGPMREALTDQYQEMICAMLVRRGIFGRFFVRVEGISFASETSGLKITRLIHWSKHLNSPAIDLRVQLPERKDRLSVHLAVPADADKYEFYRALCGPATIAADIPLEDGSDEKSNKTKVEVENMQQTIEIIPRGNKADLFGKDEQDAVARLIRRHTKCAVG